MSRGKRALEGLDRDIRDHIEREAQEHIERGVPPAEARRLARLKFGNVALVREDTRAVWVWIWLEQLVQDLRRAPRMLWRTPGFAIAVMLTLGLGIGANTAIFSLMNQVLLRTLAVPRPAELVLLDAPGIYQGRSQGRQVMSVPMFRGLQQASGSMLSGFFARFDTPATVGIDGTAEQAQAELVSGDYFRTLGVISVLGRTLGADDDRVPGDHLVVVLSHRYWQRRFGGEARVLHQAIRINGHQMTIVGVAAPGFDGVELDDPTDLFVPLMMKGELTPTWNDLDNWRSRRVNVMGRLAPGVEREQAAAALNVAYRQLLQEDVKTARLSEAERAQFLEKSLILLPGDRGRSALRVQFATPLVVLMAMVGLVLLIACANVANLLLARAASQQKEVAIRLALGAGRSRVVRQRLAESVLLASGGAVVALLFAWWTTSLLIEMLPFDRAALTLASFPDSGLVLFAIGLAGATALMSGLAPALHATKPQLTGALKEETRSVAGTRSQTRFRKGLVVAQVALSVLLLAGAGLFARSFYNLRSLDPGFVADDLIQFSVNAALSGYNRDRVPGLFRTIEDRLNALPGVTTCGTVRDSTESRRVRDRSYSASIRTCPWPA